MGALALVVWGMDWGALRTTLAGANYWWLLPFLALEVAVIWTRALRWRIMLEDRLSTARLFWITNIGYLLNNVLPLRLGEVGRVYLVTRRSTVGMMQGLSSVVVERLVDVNGNGTIDVVTAPYTNAPSEIRVFDQLFGAIDDFFAFPVGFTGGAFVG